MSKASVNFENGKLVFGVDTNEDGENVLTGSLNLSEALQEAFSRGEAVEGVKVVEVKFELTKLKVILDTDKDGENLLELVIDLAEGIDEASGIFKK